MAHGGQIVFADEAEMVLSMCGNVYGDTSWTPGYLLKECISKYGPRFMLGSDMVDNIGTELAKVETTGFDTDEQRSILETTSKEVFNL